jgi:hypothetical protein
MNTLLNNEIARERAAAAERVSTARTGTRPVRRHMSLRRTTNAAAPQLADGGVIALRFAHADESDIVYRLAELDSAPSPRGEVLLALVDGEPVAAMGLEDGRIVATPFRPTADVVAHLRLSAERLTRRERFPRRRRRLALARFAA